MIRAVHSFPSTQTFIRALVNFCKVDFLKTTSFDDHIEIKSLKLVLSTSAWATLSASCVRAHSCPHEASKDDLVTIENFSRALEWFGPFTLDQTFIINVKETISISGFFGDISSQEAEQVMAGKKPVWLVGACLPTVQGSGIGCDGSISTTE